VIVSPHVESAGTRDAGPEVSGPQSIFRSKTGKKEVSGLFAKLLAGLTKNLQSRKGTDAPEETGGGIFSAGEMTAPAGIPAAKKGDLPVRRGGAAEEEMPGQAFLAAFRPETAFGQASFKQGAGKAEPRSENILAGRFLRKQPAEGDRRLKEVPAEGEDPSPMEALFPPAAGEQPPEAAEFGAPEGPVTGDRKPAVSGGKFPLSPETGAEEQRSLDREAVLPVLPGLSKPEPAEKRNAGTKSGDRRKDRVHIEVRDLRSAAEGEQRSDRALSGVDTGVSLRKAAVEGETELVVELRGGGRNTASAENFREVQGSRYAPSFENLLARELNQSLSGDIVRHAQAVLRDGNAGTIRLTLRPETLGNVKIRLEMAENKITGHIIVESEEALRAFEREIHSLEQAFRNAGFEAADLETSLNQGGGSEQRREGGDAGPLVSAGLAASRYAREQEGPPVPEALGLYVSGGQVTVNMLI
jgi:hypothetical protein